MKFLSSSSSSSFRFLSFLPTFVRFRNNRFLLRNPSPSLSTSLIIISCYPSQVCRYRHDRNVKVRKPYNQPLLYTEDDIDETFTKGSGRGGQSVAKTNNCVVLHHLPTGTMVRCHKTRSRDLNRQLARRELQLKLDTLVNGKDSIRARLYAKDKKRRQKIRQKAKRKHHHHPSGIRSSNKNSTPNNSVHRLEKTNERKERRIHYYHQYSNVLQSLSSHHRQSSIINLSRRSNHRSEKINVLSTTSPYYPQNTYFGQRIIFSMYQVPLWKRIWLPVYNVRIVNRYLFVR